MTGLRALFRLLLLCALSGISSAQVEVQLTAARRSFVAGEAVPITVSITNRSGQDLKFEGSKVRGWIEFTVASSNGQPLSGFGTPAFGAMEVPLGQTKARAFDISRLYPLGSMGNFSVYAVVRLPGQEREGFMSNRVLFSIDHALPYWSQKIGLPGKAGENREFRVLNYNNGSKNILYSQVIDLKTGSSLQTHALGQYLNFHKPSVTIDNQQVMHVLFQSQPTVWTHVRISQTGAILGAELHRGAGGDPALVATSKGAVQVGNSSIFDPKVEAEARNRVRKASDRPAFLFQ